MFLPHSMRLGASKGSDVKLARGKLHMVIFIQINWKAAFDDNILADFRLLNRLSDFLRYKMRCVVHGCSNTSNHQAGMSLHCSRFVKTHRANFTTQGRFMTCLDNFEDRCFERSIYVKGFIRRLLLGSVATIWGKIIARAVFRIK